MLSKLLVYLGAIVVLIHCQLFIPSISTIYTNPGAIANVREAQCVAPMQGNIDRSKAIAIEVAIKAFLREIVLTANGVRYRS